MKQYGLPYQGSKSSIAEKLHNAIYLFFGEAQCFFDLFGGGGAMSDCAARFEIKTLFEDFEYSKIMYNEMDIAYFAYKWIKENGISEFAKKWVSREDFYNAVNFDFTKGTEKEKAFAAITKIIYSFGNNQRNYLYSRDLEDFKYALFLISTKKEYDVREVASLLNSRLFDNEIGIYRQIYDIKKLEKLKKHSVHLRRFSLRKCIKERIFEVQSVERVESVQSVQSVQRVEFLNENAFDILKNPEKYCNPEETIFYADPPYQDTMSYNVDFPHSEFWNLCRNFKYRLMISEYNAPDDFICVYQTEKQATFTRSENSKKTAIEKLFVHKNNITK